MVFNLCGVNRLMENMRRTMADNLRHIHKVTRLKDAVEQSHRRKDRRNTKPGISESVIRFN